MIYRFILISNEVDDFYLEIKANDDATFLDLHKTILAAVEYPDNQMTSFFICDHDWRKETEITLEDMKTSYEEDSWVMATTRLNEFLEDEHQRMLYVFDQLSERCFFIELKEIITKQKMSGAECTRKAGTPPQQTLDYEALANSAVSLDTGENFYGDEDFDSEDLDADGFDMGDGGGSDTVSLDSIDDIF